MQGDDVHDEISSYIGIVGITREAQRLLSFAGGKCRP